MDSRLLQPQPSALRRSLSPGHSPRGSPGAEASGGARSFEQVRSIRPGARQEYAWRSPPRAAAVDLRRAEVSQPYHRPSLSGAGPALSPGSAAPTGSAALSTVDSAIAALGLARNEATRSSVEAAIACDELATEEEAASAAHVRRRRAEAWAAEAEAEAQAQRVRSADEMAQLRTQAVAAASQLQSACLEAISQRDEATQALEAALLELAKLRALRATAEQLSFDLAGAQAERSDAVRGRDEASDFAIAIQSQVGELRARAESALGAARAEAARADELKVERSHLVSLLNSSSGRVLARAPLDEETAWLMEAAARWPAEKESRTAADAIARAEAAGEE
ncbi:hypothetical protein T492DRAFT_892410, partial [Pavlovales sp. CCMP2436]